MQTAPKKVAASVAALKGDEDATDLNTALDQLFDQVSALSDQYQVLHFILLTDVSADYSNGIDLSEVQVKYQYNKVPLYTVCNTQAVNSSTYKRLRTLSRVSGGEAQIYDYQKHRHLHRFWSNYTSTPYNHRLPVL